MCAPVPHLYVHVPFCDGKCDYCGFYSVAAGANARAVFATRPGRELALRRTAGDLPDGLALRTVYFGGGTPGLLGSDGVRALAESLRLPGAVAPEEWTVELSPSTTTPDLAAALAALGVSRVSIGAQCFDDAVLRAIGRRHCAADATAAVQTVHAAGFGNVGLDLIAGLPGLSADGWLETLDRAVGLDVAHLSVYALSLEPGSPLARRAAAGETMPGADAQLEALAVAEERLTAAGFRRYEISNYARPGRECQHNLACWRGEDYLGLGPAAASRVGRRRWTNRPDVAAYVTALGANADAGGRSADLADAEELDDLADATERFVFGLRLAEGVNPESFAQCWPAATARAKEWRHTLERLVGQGLVARAPANGSTTDAWRLTPRGREVADAVIRELL